MLSKYWSDYLASRPGTLGGETAISDFKRSIRRPSPPAATQPDLPSLEKPKKPPYKMTGADLALGAVVFLATWLSLWRISGIGGGTAAAVGFIASGIAARWWRQLLVVAIVAVVLFVFYHHK
jgi:hypothetical protein